MRKAFDANVPKLKPRLRGAFPVSTLPMEDLVDEAPHAVRVPFDRVPAAAAEAAAVSQAQPASTPTPTATATATAAPIDKGAIF